MSSVQIVSEFSIDLGIVLVIVVIVVSHLGVLMESGSNLNDGLIRRSESLECIFGAWGCFLLRKEV